MFYNSKFYGIMLQLIIIETLWWKICFANCLKCFLPVLILVCCFLTRFIISKDICNFILLGNYGSSFKISQSVNQKFIDFSEQVLSPGACGFSGKYLTFYCVAGYRYDIRVGATYRASESFARKIRKGKTKTSSGEWISIVWYLLYVTLYLSHFRKKWDGVSDQHSNPKY